MAIKVSLTPYEEEASTTASLDLAAGISHPSDLPTQSFDSIYDFNRTYETQVGGIQNTTSLKYAAGIVHAPNLVSLG